MDVGGAGVRHPRAAGNRVRLARRGVDAAAALNGRGSPSFRRREIDALALDATFHGFVEVEMVTTADGSLLRAVQSVLDEAEEALLCVAFVQERGVRLLEPSLKKLADRGGHSRLLATTTFESSTSAGLTLAHALGMATRVLNPAGGSTYHPKVYLGRSSRQLHAVVGSANLTGGLVSNVEAAVARRGPGSDPQLRRAWEWAEARWGDPRSKPWMPPALPPSPEVIALDLYLALEAEVRRDPVFMTLGPSPRRNRVTQITPSEVFIETERSRSRIGGAASVPAWMLNIAWDRLKVVGTVSNGELLQAHVHRSSAVCALLARIPGVGVGPGPRIGLEWRGPQTQR